MEMDVTQVAIVGVLAIIIFIITLSVGVSVFLGIQNQTASQYGLAPNIINCFQPNFTSIGGCWTEVNTTPATSSGNWTNVDFTEDGLIETMGSCSNTTSN